MPGKERILVEEWVAIKTYKYEVQKPHIPSQQRWAAVTSNSNAAFMLNNAFGRDSAWSRGCMSKLQPAAPPVSVRHRTESIGTV
jgi:hypothetical protein